MTKAYVVYPRLKKITAEKLAMQLSSQAINELVSEYSGKASVKIDYAATGNRIPVAELQTLQKAVRACAKYFGYPKTQGISNAAYSEFDNRCAILLHKMMKLTPAEAAHIEVWLFLTCVLLPDIVRWRFYNDETSIERFIGANRGLRRNAFGRLWWRAYLLHRPEREDPYEYIFNLGEDDLVQITERSSIAADPVLISASADAFLTTLKKYPSLSRRELIREAVKRVRRLFSLLSFEALDETEVVQIMNQTFEQTAQVLLSNLQAVSITSRELQGR